MQWVKARVCHVLKVDAAHLPCTVCTFSETLLPLQLFPVISAMRTVRNARPLIYKNCSRIALHGGSMHITVAVCTSRWQYALQGRSMHFTVAVCTSGWQYALQGGSMHFRVAVCTSGWQYALQGGCIPKSTNIIILSYRAALAVFPGQNGLKYES